MPLSPGTYKPWVNEVTKASSYSVLLTDTGTLFIATTGAITFTLPVLTAGIGGVWWFYCTVNSAMAITAPANKLIADGNATGTTGTFSTTSHIIGSMAMVWMNDAGTFYHLSNWGGTVCTVT